MGSTVVHELRSCERTITARRLATRSESPYGVFIPSIKLLTDAQKLKLYTIFIDVMNKINPPKLPYTLG